MTRIARRTAAFLALGTLLGIGACAALWTLVQPPIFEMAENRSAEFRIVGPAADRPLGGAQFRVWAHVHNPNNLGITLRNLAGDLIIENRHAATIDLPLGLPLPATGDTIFPIALTVSFADIPDLATQLLAAVTGQSVNYQIQGTLGVDAGPLGTPTFGPQTWLSGQLQLIR
jgi:hypothetical protein